MIPRASSKERANRRPTAVGVAYLSQAIVSRMLRKRVFGERIGATVAIVG
jgi:hypothetical protein